jgi:hypothetical protein
LFPAFAEQIFYPLGKVLEKIPFARKVGVAWIFIVPVIWFFSWYFIIKFYLLASRRFQIAIVALVVLGMTLALTLHEEKSGIDWTSRGLNPNRPGFKPQVVILSGTFSFRNKNMDTRQFNSGSAYFEIRMRGANYYYCRKWNNQEWKDGSWFNLELAIPDFAMHWGLGRGRFGTRGGGGSSLGRPEDLVLARRLWNGTNFIGADVNNLTAEEPEWDLQEEFQKLEKVGPYLIPKRIRFSEGDERDETYIIRKVEFWNQPSTNWFWDVKKKYFDHDSAMRTNDLNEPGPFLGKNDPL